MAMKFRDDNEESKPTGDSGRDAMAELRDLFDSGTGQPKPLTDGEINNRFGPDAAEMVHRVQKRLDELVNAMRVFNHARQTGGDVAPALMEFTRLMSSTMQRYNSMEISSMLATGIAAIAEMEDRFGENTED